MSKKTEWLKYKLIKDELKGYKLFFTYKNNCMYSYDSNVYIKRVLDIILKRNQQKEWLSIVSNTYKHHYSNDLVVTNSLMIYQHITSSDLYRLFNLFSNHLNGLTIYMNDSGYMKIYMDYKNYYGFNEESCSIVELYFTENHYQHKEFFPYFEKALEKMKNLTGWQDDLTRVSLQIDTKDYYKNYLLKDIESVNLSDLTIKEKIDMFYYVIVKDERVKDYLPKHIKERVKQMIIDSNFKITNEQVNLLNHLLDNRVFLLNGDGGLFYNMREKGIGWKHSRDWVKKQLKPFIESGLIALTIKDSPRDRRYKLWYFHENTNTLNKLIQSDRILPGWQTKVK